MNKRDQHKKIIGASIKRKRQETGYTQDMIAERLNITTPSYARYETGSSVPDILRVIEIADIFECGIEELLVDISPRSNDQAKNIANMLLGVKRADRVHILKIVEKICLISKGKSKIES
jgi:transcriptional regulator with XRE-family HTH domain